MERLNVLAQQLHPLSDTERTVVREATAARLGFNPSFPQATTAALFPKAVHDALDLDGLLTPAERATRDKVRAFMEAEVAPVITEYWEKAEFPRKLLPALAKLNLSGGNIEGYGCAGGKLMQNALAVVEMARVDASISTFHLVHSYLAMLTIGLLGSEQQKKELLPPMAKMELIGCFGLTEPSHGSDASAIQCSAKKVPGGWELNGFKRWIGNGTFADVVILWARNTETQQVNCFIVRKGTPGFKATKIENKVSLRCVQNADLTFEKCFVPDSARLTGVNSFKDTNKVLAVSRVMVAWQPVGLAMGVYDVCVRYAAERKQFGTAIGGFQLVQERLARMQGSIQAMFLMTWRLTKLYEEGRMTHEQASLVKAWTTLRAREVVALGREILGGQGILVDYNVGKAFCDLEAFYTYEGTYDINVLVAGRDITGQSAFKPAKPASK